MGVIGWTAVAEGGKKKTTIRGKERGHLPAHEHALTVAKEKTTD